MVLLSSPLTEPKKQAGDWDNQSNAALPPHMAVSVWLTVGPLPTIGRLCLRRGITSELLRVDESGKPEAYRYVLRQSRQSTVLGRASVIGINAAVA